MNKGKYISLFLALALFGGCGSTKNNTQSSENLNHNQAINKQDQNSSKDKANLNTHSDKVATAMITGGKSSYQLGETVSLNAKVSEDTKSYTWSEDGVVLGEDAHLSTNSFNQGKHTINLIVITEDGQTILKTFSFDVVDNSINDFTAKVLKNSDAHVIVDKAQNLMWISEKDESKKACLAMPKKEVFENSAKNFCKELVFAGFDDWRTPNTDELQDFIVSTIDEGIMPGYPKPCPLLLSKNQNGEFEGVVTRFGEKGSLHAGDIIDVQYPVGLRCVRSYTHTIPNADAGDDITVEYLKDFSFDASRSRDDDGEIVKYEWIFNGHVLNSDTSSAIYTRSASQPAGDYIVKLRVTDDDNNSAEDEVIVHVR